MDATGEGAAPRWDKNGAGRCLWSRGQSTHRRLSTGSMAQTRVLKAAPIDPLPRRREWDVSGLCPGSGRSRLVGTRHAIEKNRG